MPLTHPEEILPIECDLCEDTGFVAVHAPVYGESDPTMGDVDIKKCICQLDK